jgi:hypothetical protein
MTQKKAAFDKYSTWFGLGYKGGGILVAAGMEYLSCTMRNVGMPSEHHDFQILSARVGLGLGGSVGAVACLIYNCSNLYDLNDTQASDWSVNVAFAGKWGDVVDGLTKYDFFPSLLRIGKVVNSKTALVPSDIENIRNAMSYLWTGHDYLQGSGGKAKMITVDIPGAGIGYELSASWAQGQIEILS